MTNQSNPDRVAHAMSYALAEIFALYTSRTPLSTSVLAEIIGGTEEGWRAARSTTTTKGQVSP